MPTVSESVEGHSPPSDAADIAVLRELRDVRRARRLGDTEWFDVLYRVYLFALGGLVAVVVASDAIDGLIDDDIATVDLLSRGPSIAGVAVALAFSIGLRNGADGGPVAVESADIRHVLLSPIDRRRALLRPVGQRMRSVVFAPALFMAIVGQLVAREIEGSRAAWAASGALFGAVVGVVYVGTAVIAHAVGFPRWLASSVGGVGVAWQIVAAVSSWSDEGGGVRETLHIGPTNLAGSLLFWGIRQRAIDLFAVAAALLLIVVALSTAGRLRLEPLERRGQLVSQLRFAATVQDIRTVVLLRRQLRAESVRAEPWGGSRRPRHSGARDIGAADHSPGPIRPARRDVAASASPTVVWRRGLASLRRLPLSRVLRIGGLAIVAGVAASLTVSTSPLAAIPLVAAVFLLGLEAIEPLAQEVDRPDLTDSLPPARGWLFTHHLVAPAMLLAAAGVVGAAAATVVEPGHATGAFALAVPVALAGAIGPIVSTVRDAPEPASVASTTLMGSDRNADSPFALPEFAGASNAITGLMPIVLSAIAVGPVFAMRADPTIGTAWRSVLGVALCVGVMVWWIARRDRWAIRIRRFFVDGKAAR